MIRRAAIALCFAGGIAAADPTPYDGFYRQSVTEACEVQRAGGGAIQIDKGTFIGAESRCQMENPVDVRDMRATLYDMVCSAAETEWQTRAFFGAAAEGGLIIVLDGHAFRYDQCSPDDPLGTVTLAPVIGVEASEPTVANE